MQAIAQVLKAWENRGAVRPFFIGIGGGSAAGKSTLAGELAEHLVPLGVEVVSQDRFFKKPAEMPTYFSAINQGDRPAYNEPDSFKREEMLSYCRDLNSGDVVILEGILVLWFAELRALMDCKIYIDADADERIIRRIRRNMKSLADYDPITDYYLESVRFQHEEYNAPTREYADMVIPGGMAETAERRQIAGELCATIAAHPGFGCSRA